MRKALLLILVALPAFGQVREGETAERKEARLLLLEIYRRPDVSQACANNPEGFVTVTHREREFSVNCLTRRQYLELFDDMPDE